MTETPAHHDAVAVDTYVEVSIPAASTAVVNPETVAPSAELDYAAQRQDVAIDTLPSDAFCVSPPTMAQVPLPRLEDGVETAAPSAGTPVPSLSATTTTTAVARESSHPHLNLLHIIQRQQERIAVLQASLAHAARSAQRSSEALESLQGKPRVPACTGRTRAVSVASSPVGRASAPLASIAEVASAVSTVRWADSVVATPMPTPPVSCGSFTEWKDDLPQAECCSHTPSLPFTAPATFSPLPVVLLDITSMFTTRSTRAAAAHHGMQPSSLSTHRRSSETQTDSVATESTTPTDKDIAGSSDTTRQLMDQLRGELAGAQRRLPTADTSVLWHRASMLALQQRCSPSASSREPADAVPSCICRSGASRRFDSVSGVDGASCEGAAAECLVHDDKRKDMKELQRLRLLLRFSELKKDSDRLAEVEGALRESSAAQLRLRQRCDCLEHENSQRGDCLRAIASCVETTLAASSSGTVGNRRDGSTATAAACIEMSDRLVSLLRYVLHLCTDAALSPSVHKAPLPLPHPSPPKARQSTVQSRQDRLHKAVSDSRDGGRSLPFRPLSRMASWNGSGAAAAAALGERRASKH